MASPSTRGLASLKDPPGAVNGINTSWWPNRDLPVDHGIPNSRNPRKPGDCGGIP